MHHQTWHLQQLRPLAPAGPQGLVLPLALTISALHCPPHTCALAHPPPPSPSCSSASQLPPAPPQRMAAQATISASGADSRAAETTDTGQASQGWGADGQGDMYVWYASYGSNMWEDRFLCYIRGGKVEGMSRSCPGSSDPTPPVSSTWVAAPHRSWFGRSRTATWGDGGVCFLDPLPWPSRRATLPTAAPNAHPASTSNSATSANSAGDSAASANGTSAHSTAGCDENGSGDSSSESGESEEAHHTLLRLHKIRLQQFNDVVAQENMMHFSQQQPQQQPQQEPQHQPGPSSEVPSSPCTEQTESDSAASTAQGQAHALAQTCAPSPDPPPPLVPKSLILRLRSQPLLGPPSSAPPAAAVPDNLEFREGNGNGNGTALGSSFPPSVDGMLPPVSAPAYEEVIPGGWYGTVLYLGDLEGSPILTFTCNAEDAAKFYLGKLPTNAPSATYHAVVGRGLETSGMSEGNVQAYIKVRAQKLHKH